MTIRIHSGIWKGTRLAVSNLPGLRPTSSRLRETLANWIRHQGGCEQVLDLFAGSGALGFEVCSNLNSEITFIDSNRQLTTEIEQRLLHLDYTSAQVHCRDAFAFLRSSEQTFDLVLLDPPFALNRIEQLPELVEQSKILAQTALIYFEYHHKVQPAFPENWTQLKHTRVGQVKAGLWRRYAQ